MLLLLPIGLNSIYAEYTIEWSIPFSVYRLIYNFTVHNDTPEAYVHVVIPESIIDQYLQYWRNKGIDPFRYHDFYAPRVYYVKVIAPTGPGGTYSLEYYYVQRNITCYSSYNYYCNNFTVYLKNIPAGTHHIVIYMPAFFWEDFEDNSFNVVADAVGECIDGEWCVYNISAPYYATVGFGGWDPTPGKLLVLSSYDGPRYGHIVLYKDINIPVTHIYPLIVEFDSAISSMYYSLSFTIEFELTDGSKVAFVYGHWTPPNVNACGNIPFGTGHLRADPLKDIWQYCNININRISKITRIYVGTMDGGVSIDNIKIFPSYLYT
jgi:hypothetical protein